MHHLRKDGVTLKRLLCLGALLASSSVIAQEPAACRAPFNDFINTPASSLRTIAQGCTDETISDLFFYRAYHRELMDEFRFLAQLESYSDQGRDTAYYQSQRMFIGLAEAFAHQAWLKGDRSSIQDLIASYDQAIETAELQLRGNDLLANKRLFPQAK